MFCDGNKHQNETDLHLFSIKVHLDQRVSNQVSETAAIKVAVRAGVVLGVVYLRELQAAVVVKFLPVKVLVGAVDLQGEGGNTGDGDTHSDS